MVKRARPARSGAVVMACALLIGCTGEPSDGGSADPETVPDPTEVSPDDRPGEVPAVGVIDLGSGAAGDHARDVAALTRLLPSDTRGVAAIDVAALGGLPATDGIDPLIGDVITTAQVLTGALAGPDVMTTALVAHTTDPADGSLVLGRVPTDVLAELTSGTALSPESVHEESGVTVYADGRGTLIALVPGGVVVAGGADVVTSVLDHAAGTTPPAPSPIEPFLAAVDPSSTIGFVYGLPALSDDSRPLDGTLRDAVAVSAGFDVGSGQFGGRMAFHTRGAEAFVETFNALDQPAILGGVDQPLVFDDPLVGDFGQVVVTIPPGPLAPSFDELRTSRNIFKKLFVGADALAYADGVDERTEPAWLDFVVRSEADGGSPPSPGSVYIRWAFRDQAAIEAFEQNELPAGFRLAPTQFLESDDPAGEYFFALNIYNAGGGSIVGGTRAEWDVFVHGPDGADPDAGERPRFHVVDVLAEEVSADAGNLLTTAQPLSYELVDGFAVSDIRRFEGDGEVPVFSSTFPVPDPATAEVARFTREMAIGNDYIYWAHGVYDRVLYNATTFNHDAYFVDTTQLEFVDSSRWSQYLDPEVLDAVYYVNDLEYVASPMANLDSDHLDIEPDWLDQLVGFTTNGHQSGLMRAAVEQLFRGDGDPFVGLSLANDTPATSYHFEIADPAGLEAAVALPPGHTLAPTTLFAGDEAAHYLTLSVRDVDGSIEGTRAEWSVYVDDGSGRPPHLMVIDLVTEEVAFDSYDVIHLPGLVEHARDGASVRTRLATGSVEFDATFSTSDTTRRELSLDWIEAGDRVCRPDAICDLHYYDAETLDVPVQVPDGVVVDDLATPWDAFLAPTRPVVFFRDNFQEYAVKPWYDLDVPVDEPPFVGLAEPTHSINGSGTLTGRSDDVADSEYTYTGDVRLDGDTLTFAIDQEVVNALGVGHIFTTGSFDLSTASGTQTVVDCQGPALLCSDIENGATAFYTAQELDVADPDAITWQVDAAVDLGPFGIADSVSTFTATRVG